MRKICSTCKIEKETTEFYKATMSKDGLYPICKKCSNLKNKLWQRIHKKEQRLYYRQNRHIRREYEKNYRLKPEVKFKKYQENAKCRNIEFDLTFKQFMQFWQNTCHYCGIKIKTIGIDRVDNTKGYNINNIISCCGTCNNMKNKLPEKTFVIQCKKISDYILKSKWQKKL